MKFFYKHLIYGTLIIFGLTVLHILGVNNLIYEKDFTKISFLIMTILAWFSIRNIKLTYLLAKTTKKENLKEKDLVKFERKNETNWMVSDVAVTLGLIGTMFGLIAAIGLFGNIVNISIASMQSILPQVALKISAALYTTLVGLISSVLIKLQAYDISHFIARKGEIINGKQIINNSLVIGDD